MNFAGHFLHFPRLTWPRGIALAMLMLLAGCGFTMRGVTPLPFDTLYVGIPDNTRFGADVRRALRAASPNTRQVPTSRTRRPSCSRSAPTVRCARFRSMRRAGSRNTNWASTTRSA